MKKGKNFTQEIKVKYIMVRAPILIFSTFALTIMASTIILKFLLPRKSLQNWEIVLFGYIYASLIFFVVVVLFDTPNIFQVILLSTIPLSLRLFKSRNRKKFLVKFLLLIALISIVLPSHSYKPNLGQASNYLNYWHSGNNDLIDALCGAKSVTPSLEPENETNTSIKEKNEATFSYSWVCGVEKQEYLSDLGRLQYTNIALFSIATNSYPSMWLVLFQSILNLFLFYFASRKFGESVLNLSRRRASAVSLFSVGGSFYFSTFVNGHIGTMMIAAPLAWTLSNFFSADRKKRTLIEVILTFTAVLFISLAYLYIVPFLIVFYIVSISRSSTLKYFRYKSHIFMLAINVILFVASWIYFSDSRLNADSRFRSWGSFMTALAPFQYLGIFPPNVMGATSLGNVQDFWSSLGITSNIEFFILSLPVLIPMAFWASNTRKKFSGYPVNRLFGILMALPIILVVSTHDPYFVYKTSYIFQFVVLSYIAAGTAQKSLSSDRKRKFRTKTVFSIALAVTVSSLNLSWNLDALSKIVSNNKTWGNFSSQIANMRISEINDSISILNESPEENISNYILSLYRGPTTNTKGKNLAGYDIVSLPNHMYSSKQIVFRSIPEDTLRISPNGVFGVEENSKMGNFRWIAGNKFEKNEQPPGPGFSGRDSAEYSIFFERLNSSYSSATYKFCASIADWITLNQVELLARDKKGRELGRLFVGREKKCFDVLIPGDVQLFSLNSKIPGEYPSLFDRRRILYRLWVNNIDSSLIYSKKGN